MDTTYIKLEKRKVTSHSKMIPDKILELEWMIWWFKCKVYIYELANKDFLKIYKTYVSLCLCVDNNNCNESLK